MEKQTISVRVPATVGNFGSAAEFGTLALDASLNLKVSRRRDGHVGIRYFGENGERVPRDRSNLVVRAIEAALHVKKVEFTGADLEIFSSVPVAVGLGSSTAAVLAGLISANLLYRLGMDEKSLFELAALYEQRNGNLRAAWMGGFVACVESSSGRGRGGSSRKTMVYQQTVVPEDLVLHVVVPETSLVRMPHSETAGSVKKSKGRKRTAGKSATHAAAKKENVVHLDRAAALSEFLVGHSNSIPFEPNVPLPPTCKKHVPGLEEALQIRTPGLLSVFLCGSGPAVGVFGAEDSYRAVDAVREAFARNRVASKCYEFRPTNLGALDWNSPYGDLALSSGRRLGDSPSKNISLPV
jgi:homoserine kinase